MKAHEWIDRLKVTRGLSSDYAVAKILDTRPSTISNYRTRNSTLDDDLGFKLAIALDIAPEFVLADQAMERTKNEGAKVAWARLLDGLKGKSLALAAAADGDGWRKRSLAHPSHLFVLT